LPEIDPISRTERFVLDPPRRVTHDLDDACDAVRVEANGGHCQCQRGNGAAESSHYRDRNG